MTTALLRVPRAGAWALAPGLLGGAALGTGTWGVDLAVVPVLVAMAACWAVGLVVTLRVPLQPAGWAFLGLGTALAWSGFTEMVAMRGLETSAPWALALAALSDSSWLWWFAFMALSLQLTATPTGQRARRWASATLGLAALAQVLMLIRTAPLAQPFAGAHSPFAFEPAADVVNPMSAGLSTLLGIVVLASLVRLVIVWHKSRGEERKRLLWLVAGVLPILPCVIGAFVASFLGAEAIATLFIATCLITTTAGAGLSILRYRLYDVERVLSESAAYATAAAAVVLAYGLAILVLSRTTPIAASSRLATVAATLAGVAVARQSYRWTQRAVGRQLNRRRFDAVEVVQRGLREGVTDLEALVAEALGDPEARVLYPAEHGRWVTAQGDVVSPVRATAPARSALLEYNRNLVSDDVVQAVAREAAAEIDNVALRAELARQVALVSESRARLSNAHIAERQRMERDLHDGAQQRILAIALTLRSARINGSPDVIEREVDRAIEHLGMTVRELRELASGMQPLALSTGGIRAAVADLAERLPIPIDWEVTDRRFAERTEATAWFVIAETVTNAVKHASASRLVIQVDGDHSGLSIRVADDGRGGADPDGSGLRGLADRVEAHGGALTVRGGDDGGTHVVAELTCAS